MCMHSHDRGYNFSSLLGAFQDHEGGSSGGKFCLLPNQEEFCWTAGLSWNNCLSSTDMIIDIIEYSRKMVGHPPTGSL